MVALDLLGRKPSELLPPAIEDYLARTLEDQDLALPQFRDNLHPLAAL